MCANVKKILWVPSRRSEDTGFENGKKSKQIIKFLIYAVVPYFMVNTIPGIITGVTLPLSYDICLPLLLLLLFYGEFNTWYYCWRDSASFL